MAELVVKKWQFGRFLAAKNTEKAASKRITANR